MRFPVVAGLVACIVLIVAPTAAAQQRSDFGTLAIQVRPPDADIYIDGERWTGPSTAGPLLVQLSAGSHRVELRAPGREPYFRDITIRAGDTIPLNVSLARAAEPVRERPQAPAGPPPGGRVQTMRDDDGPVFAPDVRITEIDHETSTLVGMYGGWVFDNQLLVGAGGYWQANTTHGTRMAYAGPVVEWRAFPDRKVGFSLHGLVGAGVRYAEMWPVDDWDDWAHRNMPRYYTVPYGWFDNDVFFIAEPEVQIVLRFGSSMRLQGGIGYRATSARGLDGATGSISLQFGR